MTTPQDIDQAERVAVAIHDRVRSCLLEIAGRRDAAEGIARLSLSDLVAWREIALSSDRTPAEDLSWLEGLLQDARDAGLADLPFRIGQGMKDTPIEEAFRSLGTAGKVDDAEAARRGLEQQLLSSMSQRFPDQGNASDRRAHEAYAGSLSGGQGRRDPSDVELPRRILGACSGEICASVIDGILQGLVRKPLLRHLNIVLLVEEALLEMAGGIGGAENRRKLAMEYAVTRLLEAISRRPGMDMAEITAVFRAIGNMSRLNRSISNGLDRVQDHAARAAKDGDLAEAALLSGRPAVSSHADIRAAARQCRMFRDREKA